MRDVDGVVDAESDDDDDAHADDGVDGEAPEVGDALVGEPSNSIEVIFLLEVHNTYIVINLGI